jgi:catechol 2,3-dioxygenase-like lactoylglutathione lyase family enzyme
MPRGLDHIVHAVRDLDAAADLYRRLGFTVGARNQHPWGTHNHIVQLPGFFIELLTLAEPDKIGDDGFSKLFAAYNRDFAQRHEGLSLLIVESQDADADVAAFPDVASGARLAALRFDVADPGLLEAVPEQAGIAGLFAGNATVIGSEDAMGAVLVFEPAARKPR